MSRSLTKLRSDLYRPGDEADILAMNLAEYGPADTMVNPEDFRWRHAENPAGQAQITVVRDEDIDQVIGFTWMVPLHMRLFGQDYVGAMTTNQLIRPDYRGSMAYAKMIRHRLRLLRKSTAFRYSFPADDIFESTVSIEKMSAFDIPLLIRPLNLVQLAQMLYTRRWMGLLSGWGGQVVSPLLFYSRAGTAQRHSLKIEWLDHFDERFDDLWQRVQDKYNIMVVRDRAFLAWRFAPVSRRAYRILTASADGELIGYAILRCTDEIRGIPIGLIMDLLLEPGARGEAAGLLLLANAWQHFREEKVWLAGALAFPHTVEYQVVRRAGYRPCPPRLAPRRFRIAFNCFDSALPDTTDITTCDWFTTIADYEAH
jgi:hypothetical protein